MTDLLTNPNISDSDLQKYLKIVEHGLESTAQAAKIIIIGAGIAGLTAAYELSRAGHTVVMLEATQRAGGRVYTLREPFADNLFGEAGAMRYPPSHHLLMHYLNSFNIETTHHYNFNPEGILFFNNKKQRMGVMSKQNIFAPTKVFQQWRTTVAPIEDYYFAEEAKGNRVWSEIVKKYNEMSLRDFLIQEKWTENDIDLFGKIGLGLGGYASIMSCSFLEIFRLFLVENDKYQKSIVGGSDRLINAFLDTAISGCNHKIKNMIHFGAVVKKIVQHNNHDIIVEYDNLGEHHFISGNYVICTVPFPMLRFIDIQPTISSGKQRAINELHYFSATKIFLQCKSRFWELPHHRTHGLTLTDLPIRSLYFPEPNEHSQRGVIIASYTWEKESRMWEALSPEDRIKHALYYTAKIYPEITSEFEVGASCCWHDPQYYTGGAFAIFSPGQMMTLTPHLSSTEGRLHFAGDHTSYEHGWIEGAIQSGLREALAITQRIQSTNSEILSPLSKS